MGTTIETAKEIVMYSKELEYSFTIKLIGYIIFLAFALYTLYYCKDLEPKNLIQEFIKNLGPWFAGSYIFFLPLTAYTLQPGISETTILGIVIAFYTIGLMFGLIGYVLWQMGFWQKYLGIGSYRTEPKYRKTKNIGLK